MERFFANLSKVLAHSVVFFKTSEYKGAKLYAFSSSTTSTTTGSGARGYETTAEQLKAFTEGLPALMQVTNKEILPAELAKAEVSRQVSPIYADINKDIYAQYGPELNQIGNEIARQNALASAENDLAVLKGPGQELVRSALDASKIFDPEYFALREQMAGQMSDLLQPGLSGGEREEINRYLARENQATGNQGAGAGNSTVLANAATFGGAARDRMANSLSLATGMLPVLRSNVDTFQQATGKPSMINTGEARTPGAATNIGASTMGMAGQFLGETGANARLGSQLNSSSTTRQTSTPSVFSSIVSGINAFNPFKKD